MFHAIEGSTSDAGGPEDCYVKDDRDLPPGQKTLNHYTTEKARMSIQLDGAIKPSAESGVSYYTPQIFQSGEDARARLEMSVTPEGYFAIPLKNFRGVEPVPGKFPNSSGGLEFWQKIYSVSVEDAVWVPIGP